MFIWSDDLCSAINSRHIREVVPSADGPNRRTGEYFAVVYLRMNDVWDEPGLEFWSKDGFTDFGSAHTAACDKARQIVKELNGEQANA